jgi:hypothetical protein
MHAQHVSLCIESRDGKPRTEPVHVQPLPDGNYVLLHSPGFVQGIAAGDEFALTDAEGSFQVIRRSGNLAIQIFSKEAIVPLLPTLSALASRLGGVLDGNISQGAVLTVPVAAGFSTVEAELSAFVAQHPSCAWYYGNVYSPSDGITPLFWWMHV